MSCSSLVMLVAAALAQSDAVWHGEFVVTSPKTYVHDGRGQEEVVRPEMRFTYGDQVTTGARGGASFFLFNGCYFDLAPSTVVRFADAGEGQGLVIDIKSGEARVVNPGRTHVIIETGMAAVIVERGVTWFNIDAKSTQVWNESGDTFVVGVEPFGDVDEQVQLTSGSREQRLNEGREVLILSDGRVAGTRNGTRFGRHLNPTALRRQAAVTLAQLQVPPPPAAGPATTPPPAPGATAGEDDEERRERDPENQQPVPTTPPLQTRSPAAPTTSNPAPRNDQTTLGTLANVQLGFGGLFSFSGVSGSSATAASGGFNADAGRFVQDPVDPTNPTVNAGPIFVVGAQSRYQLSDVALLPSEQFTARNFSIGTGAAPTTFVSTVLNNLTGDALIGSGDPVANTPGRVIPIPGFDAYLLQLDVFDSSVDPVGSGALLPVTANPGSFPAISGAQPLADGDAKINPTNTFAYGELRITGTQTPTVDIRRADDDRDTAGLTLNSDLQFESKTVIPDGNVPAANEVVESDVAPGGEYAPGDVVTLPTQTSVDNLRPRGFSDLSPLRRSAVTTMMADQLFDYASRTGQTRFVLDGRIIDISGYRR